MAKVVTIVAIIVIALASIGLVYAILTPSTNGSTMGGMGSWGMQMGGETYNLPLLLLSAFALAGAIVIAAVSAFGDQGYSRPPMYAMTPQTPPPIQGQPSDDLGTAAPNTDSEGQKDLADDGPPRNFLILRLLSDDEKLIYKAIMDSGGSALQKDLILNTRMSKAKVTRVLDKLQSKGLVTRERHSSTNMIRIRD